MKLEKKDIIEIVLDLTGYCNLQCPLCLSCQKNDLHLTNIRSLSDITAQLDEYQGLDCVDLAGVVSEPTLYPYIFELIEYVNSRDIRLEVYSNASIHGTDFWYKMGQILKPKDMLVFTVCGSNQETHGKYRVNSNLEKLLENAEAFRQGAGDKKNDHIQLIRFNYNAEDLETDEMKAIVSKFNNNFLIDSLPYQERFNYDTDIKMVDEKSKIYNRIKALGEKRFDLEHPKMKCKSFDEKAITIDQFGKPNPCFLWSLNNPVAFDLDYTDILAFKNKFCWECESMSCNMLESNGMERMS